MADVEGSSGGDVGAEGEPTPNSDVGHVGTWAPSADFFLKIAKNKRLVRMSFIFLQWLFYILNFKR